MIITKSLTRLLAKHWIVCGLGFAVGVIGWIAVSRAAPKYYFGSALVASNRPIPAALELGAESRQHEQMASQLREVTAHLNWTAISEQYRPYPNIRAASGIPQAAAYLASQVSIQQIAAPSLGGEAIQISYTAKHRDVALGVIDAVADGFAKAPPVQDEATARISDPLPIAVAPPKPARPLPPSQEQRAQAVPVRQGPSVAALSSKLQASLVAGEELQQTLRQNTTVLGQLQESLQKIQSQAKAAAAIAANPPPEKREYKKSAQEEQLQADVAKAQRDLADLKTRYTDEYPEVVAAKDKVRDLHLDLDRIIAASNAAQAKAVAVPQPKPLHQQLPDAAPVIAQITTTQAFQTKLQQDIEENQAETSRLRAALAKAQQRETIRSAAEPSETASPSLPSDGLYQEAAGAPSSIDSSSPPQADLTSASTAPSSGRSSAIEQGALQSPFILVSEPTITTHPAIFAESLLWPFAFLCGLVSAFLAIWIAEQVNPAIRNERMLHREIPPSAVYLGGIPRIKHEVISD